MLIYRTIYKRFSDFIKFHELITRHTNTPAPFSTPPKSYSILGFPVGIDDAPKIQHRKADIQEYLMKILEWDGPWRDSEVAFWKISNKLFNMCLVMVGFLGSFPE